MMWKYHIDIKQHLLNCQEENDIAKLPQIAEAIAQECEKLSILKDEGFPQLFRDAGETKDIEEFDAVLSDLYDFADETKIWVGL